MTKNISFIYTPVYRKYLWVCTLLGTVLGSFQMVRAKVSRVRVKHSTVKKRSTASRFPSKKPKVTKRSFFNIRKALLRNLAQGQHNLRTLSLSSKVNWRTTRNHMIYLVGMGYAREVFSSAQVRIFEITQQGMEVLAKNAI